MASTKRAEGRLGQIEIIVQLMKKAICLLLFTLLFYLAVRSDPVLCSSDTVNSATLHFTLDHNRIIIKAGIHLHNGEIKWVNAWVDNGTPGMSMTANLVSELEMILHEDMKTKRPIIMQIGQMSLSLSSVWRHMEVEKGATVGSGMKADMNIPAALLYHYDIIIDYPHKRLTIAIPGHIHFEGKAVKGFFNPRNYLVQLPANLDSDHFNLALDIGTPVTFVTGELVAKWSTDHPSWRSVYGAVGITNLWGSDDEPRWQLLRVSRRVIIFTYRGKISN
ncbi:MAG TPA: hypothetical protein VHZ50_09770 [Puia sp.]|nr:hypothetical protein [Puia sp.]